MEQRLNEFLKVETYDVADMKSNWRIVYFPEKGEMMVVTSYGKANDVNGLTYDKSVILTKSQAPKAYPKVFRNSQIGKARQQQHKIILTITPEQYAFLHRFGNVNAYIRSLIDNQMKTKKHL